MIDAACGGERGRDGKACAIEVVWLSKKLVSWELTYTTLRERVVVLGGDGAQEGHSAGESGNGLHFAWKREVCARSQLVLQR